MGIRIHKVMGWGLTDLQCEYGKRPTDPRINNHALDTIWDDENYTLEGYKEYLTKAEELIREQGKFWFNLELMAIEEADEKRLWMSDTLVFDSEFGMQNVLMLTPLGFKDWRRYDDPIDWIEESEIRPPQENHVEVLEHPPYPFNGSYMDKRTGERADNEIMWWIRACSALKEGRGEIDDYTMSELAKLGGFEDHEDAQENCAPIVPEEIQLLAGYLNLFTDTTKGWTELRPMLYTYWS